MMSGPRRVLAPLATLAVMLLAGCLTAVPPADDDGTVTIDDVTIPNGPIVLPDLPATARSAAYLQPFDSCMVLEQSMKDHIRQEMLVDLLQLSDQGPGYGWYYGGGWLEDDCAECAMSADSAESGNAAGGAPQTTRAPRVEGEDFSGTNNQEEGVDEADFVKTDGYNLYVLRDNLLNIMEVPEFGELELTSTTPIEGTPSAMLLDGDRMVIISSVYPWDLPQGDPLREQLMVEESSIWGIWWRVSSLTKLTVLDLTNRSAPTEFSELYVQGNYQTAREVDGSVRIVTYNWMDMPGIHNYPILPQAWWEHWWTDDWTQEEKDLIWNHSISETIGVNERAINNLSLQDLLPAVHERLGDGTITSHLPSSENCADVSAAADATSRGFVSVWTIDLNANGAIELDGDHVMSSWASVVYASADILVVAEQANDWWWFWNNPSVEEATNLHVFDITGVDSTDYIASGRVPGTVRDQFALSWDEGILRVATTTGNWGRWWINQAENGPADWQQSHVYTLAIDADPQTAEPLMTTLGHVGGIAYNESLWSVRFDGDMAYIVTFQNMDPLWSIDLSDPMNPVILDELEVPGVSTYIHPLDNGRLLTIGMPPRDAETGLGLDWSQVQISLFNATDPTNLSLIEALPISPVPSSERDRWSWSYSEATYEHKAFQYWGPKGLLAIPMSTYRYWNNYTNGEYNWGYEFVSKLILINVTDNDLSIEGVVDQSDFYNDTDDNRWWYRDTAVRRSVFMGDYVYAIGQGLVTVTNLTTYETVDLVELPESEQWRTRWTTWYDDTTVESDDTTDTAEGDDDA